MKSRKGFVLRQGYVPTKIVKQLKAVKDFHRYTWSEMITAGLTIMLGQIPAHLESRSNQKRTKALGKQKRIYKEKHTAWPFAVYQGNVKLGSYRTLEVLKEKHPDAVGKN